MTITSLMIPCVEACYTSEYIANTFWDQSIARVSRVTLLPYLKENDQVCCTVYIEIGEWFDSETAYNFIKRLNDPMKETRMIHTEGEEKWWSVEINRHYMGNVFLYTYSHDFSKEYFFKKIQYPEKELEEGEIAEEDGWSEINHELNEMRLYQQLEHELCL